MRTTVSTKQLLLADDHLISMSPYNPDEVVEIKRIPGAKWDKAAKVWRVPLSSLHLMRAFAERHGFDVDPEVLRLDVPASGGPAWVRVADGALRVWFPYDPLVLAEFRRLLGDAAIFDKTTHIWSVPLEHTPQVVAWAGKFHYTVAPEVLGAQRNLDERSRHLLELSQAVDGVVVEIPTLHGTLRPSQHVAVQYCLEARRTFLADAMGSGKTACSLATLEKGDGWPAIVVCPASLVLNWQAELRRWFPHRSSVVLQGVPKPDLIKEIKRSLSLDAHVRRDRLEERQHVMPAPEVPPVEVHLPPIAAPGVGPVVVELAAEARLDPLHDLQISVSDVDAPVGGEAAEAAFSIDEGGEVSAISDLDRGDETPPRLALQGKVDVAPGAEVVEGGGRHADDTSDLGNAQAFVRQLLAKSFDLVADVDSLTHADLIILGYSTVHAWSDVLRSLNPTSLVLDESHACKTSTSQRTKAAKRLARTVPDEGFILLISGTPVENGPDEYAAQLDILGQLDAFGGTLEFWKAYCGGFKDRQDHWHHDGATRLVELNERLRSSCYLRRTKAQLLPELAPIERPVRVFVVPDDKVMRDYRRTEAEIAKNLAARAKVIAKEQGLNANSAKVRRLLMAQDSEAASRISTLRQLVAQAKMNAVGEFVEGMLEDPETKVILAAHHRAVVDELANRFGGLKIQGGMKAAEIEAGKSRFQNIRDARVITLSIMAAKEGHTLTAAQDVVFVELPWTPTAFDQVVSRAHRIGQLGSVQPWVLSVADTVDDEVWSTVEAKRAMVEAATDGVITSCDDDGDVEDRVVSRLVQMGLELDRD